VFICLLLFQIRNFQTSAVQRDIDQAAKYIGAGAATVGVAGSGMQHSLHTPQKMWKGGRCREHRVHYALRLHKPRTRHVVKYPPNNIWTHWNGNTSQKRTLQAILEFSSCRKNLWSYGNPDCPP
jgi:hypothetical protein